MLVSASLDRGLTLEKEKLGVFTADRRWILGERNSPVPPLEIIEQLPQNATHYAKSSEYSILVTDRTHVKYTRMSSEGPQEKDEDFMEAIDVISPAPIEGYFLISTSMGNMYLITNEGRKVAFPKMRSTITSTSFFWFEYGREILLLAGSQFSEIICYHITKRGIRDQPLFFSDDKAPTSSIALVTYNNCKYIIVATFLNLLILKWEDMDASPVLLRKEERTGRKKNCIPSFVTANDEYIAWLTNEELRVYTHKQLIEDEVGSVALSCQQLQNILYVDSPTLLSQLTQPITMSKNYLIIGASSKEDDASIVSNVSSSRSGTSVIIGLDPMTLRIAFRIPLGNANERIPLSIQMSEVSRALMVMTDSCVYKLDLSNEKPYVKARTIINERDERLRMVKSSNNVSTEELLALFLKEPEFNKATRLLRTTLSSIKLPNVSEDEMEPLSEEDIQEILMQFLIYELNVISMCNEEDGIGDLRAPRKFDTHGKFDMLASLAHILRLREFSRVGEKLGSMEVIESQGNNETSIALLLEKAVDESQSDMLIVNLLKTVDSAKYKDVVVTPLNPDRKKEAADMIKANKFGQKETREAIKKILNPEAKDKHEFFVQSLAPEVVSKIGVLLTSNDLTEEQIKSVRKALDMVIDIKDPKQILPSIIMRYKDIVKDKFKHPDEETSKEILYSLKYMPGQMPSAACFELLKIFGKQDEKASSKKITVTNPPVDEIIWELAISEGDAEDKDEKLFDMLTDANHNIVLSNGPETYQHLHTAHMYKSAAHIAIQAGMFNQAIFSISCISKQNRKRNFLLRKFIHQTPRTMWEELCKKYGILHLDENEKGDAEMTKDKLAKQFDDLKTKIEKLQRDARNSAEFLQELDQWVNESTHNVDRCTYCGKMIGKDLAYTFPCGHCFHEKCLEKAARSTLHFDELEKLDSYKNKKLTPQEKQDKEKLLTYDCPECGQRAVNSISAPLEAQEKWGIPY